MRRSKSHQGKFSLVLLFVAIFAFWWGIAVLSQNGKGTYAQPQSVSASATNAGTYAPQNIAGPVDVTLEVKGSTLYTYSGSLMLTSACDTLSTGIAVNGTNPERVTILLNLAKPLDTCTEATGDTLEQPFAVSLAVASGTKAVLDGLTVNGVIVPTNFHKVTTN